MGGRAGISGSLKNHIGMRTGAKPKTFRGIAVALYADGNGKYQKEYDELWSALVPESGSAASLQGELVRLIGRLASEYYRNGNMNWELGYQNMAHCLQAELNKAFPEKREIINGIVARIILPRQANATTEMMKTNTISLRIMSLSFAKNIWK